MPCLVFTSGVNTCTDVRVHIYTLSAPPCPFSPLPPSLLPGEDELRLKKRRDESASKCLEIRRKLLASREAMQQISDIASKKRQDSSTSVITSYGTK